MIISIDESNFRVDGFKRRKWTFLPDNRSVCSIMNRSALETESQLPPIDPAYLPDPVVAPAVDAPEESNVATTLMTRSRSLIKGCSKRTTEVQTRSRSKGKVLKLEATLKKSVTKPRVVVEEVKEPLPIVHQSKLK